MNGLQWALLSGATIGAGLALLIARLAPAYPNLAQSLALFAPTSERAPTTEKSRGWEAVGTWGLAKLPERIRPLPLKDLALLQTAPAAFIARKLAFALAGLTLPSLVATGAILVGFPLPWATPAFVALLAAAAAFLLPDLEVKGRAASARREFNRTLACYVDLVAMERACGSGTKQALDAAAAVGDSWVFLRLREALDRATWAGQTGWDGLRDLASELDLADLADLADIIRLSGTEGAGIYRILRAKARSMREGILLKDLTKANEANEKMSLPVSVLGIVFLAILIGPALITVLAG